MSFLIHYGLSVSRRLAARTAAAIREDIRNVQWLLRPPLRVAVVGCGAIAPVHVAAYQTVGARVVAVSDIDVAALESALDRWPGIRAYRDYGRMLDEERPDIVSVCTWPETHAEIVIRAARTGVRGILCEKPLALIGAETDEMRAVCDRYGVHLAGGHQYRFHPHFGRAAALVTGGRLGRIERLEGYITGAMIDNGPHLMDAVQFVMGDPEPVWIECACRRTGHRLYQNIPVEDAASGTVMLEGGVPLTFQTGDLAPGFFEIVVYGSEGVLHVSPTILMLDDHLIAEEPPQEADYRARQFGRFLSWVMGRESDYAADGARSARATEMALAACEAARSGETVSWPLRDRTGGMRRIYDTSEHPPTDVRRISAAMLRPGRNECKRLAVDGGRRAMRDWFSHDPVIGLSEWARLTRTIQTRQLNSTYGYQVNALEREFADMYGSPRAVASTSGTAAIHIALGAIDPEPCDEIITTPLTDMGTIIPILAGNCIPVFADVDPATGNLTAESIAARITPRTRAVILVHLFGRPADLEPIAALLRDREIPLIEDCSQAHWAEYRGRKVGTWGDFGCFSLQQSKQITSGDGGLTLVNRQDLAERAALFADKGWSRDIGREHLFLGMNYRMTELQAAVARAQLRRLPELVARRRASAEAFTRRLREIEGIVPPPEVKEGASSWWVYAFGVDSARLGVGLDDLCHLLGAEGMRIMRRYLPCAVFEYQAMVHQRTYGHSRYPFSAVDYDPPNVADYAGFRAFQDNHLFIPWSNRVTRRHTAAMAAAIARWYRIIACRGRGSG